MADKASVYASMFVRRGDQVLLVEQQGPDDVYPVWSVHGGGVEVGETPQEGAIRETWEETGLRVTKVGALTYVTSIVTRSGGRGIVLAFEANEFEATEALLPQLPEDYILRAEFLSLPDALHRLDQSPYRYIVEPMMAYLKGDARLGTLWQVIFGANESDAILTRN